MCGSAERTTATGRASSPITISTPARTRTSTSAKLLAASASEMWMTFLKRGHRLRHQITSDDTV
jgi:hypothetical protein